MKELQLLEILLAEFEPVKDNPSKVYKFKFITIKTIDGAYAYKVVPK